MDDIWYSISPTKLRQAGASKEDVEVYESICLLSKQENISFSWTSFHDLWFAKAYPTFQLWLQYRGLHPAVSIPREDLHGIDLSRAYLSGANLTSANLENSNLYNTFFRCANLSGANLRGADLSAAYLEDADMSSTDLSGAKLYGAVLRGANLENTLFVGADLTCCNIDPNIWTIDVNGRAQRK